MIEMLRCRGIARVHEQQFVSLVPPYQQQIQQIAVQNASAGFYALQSIPEGQGQMVGSETSARVAWNDSPLLALSQLSSFDSGTEVLQVVSLHIRCAYHTLPMLELFWDPLVGPQVDPNCGVYP